MYIEKKTAEIYDVHEKGEKTQFGCTDYIVLLAAFRSEPIDRLKYPAPVGPSYKFMKAYPF